MSLINDALNKVQQQRKETVTARAMVRYPGSPLPNPIGVRERAPARTPAFVWVLVNTAVLVLLFAGYHFFFRDAAPALQPSVVSRAPAPSPVEIAATEMPAAATADDQAVRAEPTPATPSPFKAAPAPTAEYAPLDTEFDLAGMTVVGKNTLLSITRRSDQRSFWVPVGKTVGEVTAISYDADKDNARIRVRGRLVTIAMRNASLAP
jgi:hypothetical protein